VADKLSALDERVSESIPTSGGGGTRPNRRLQTDEEKQAMFDEVNLVSRYLQMLGMFEIKNGTEYQTYGDVNLDIFTWKEYDNPELEENAHQLLEINITLEDGAI